MVLTSTFGKFSVHHSDCNRCPFTLYSNTVAGDKAKQASKDVPDTQLRHG